MSEAAVAVATPSTPAPAAPAPAAAPPNATPGAAPSASSEVRVSSPDWASSLNEDMRGYVQNKGFKDPSMVLDSYRNLEKLLGAPKERLLKLPEKADDKTGWDEVYSKLGRPGTPNDYKIPVPEKGADENFLKATKGMFHEAGLTQSQAEKLSSKWNEYAVGVQNEQTQAQQAKNQTDLTSLKKEWGAAFDQNVAIGKKAAATFGLDAASIDKLESALGFSGVVKLMHNIGSKLGEDGFVAGGTQRFGSALTPEAAKNRINSLKGDKEFVGRYLSRDTSAVEEMARLHQFAYPDEA